MLRTIGDVVSTARELLNDPAPSGSGTTFSGTATTRTLGMVLTEARSLFNDTKVPYRYSDADLYRYVGSALLQVRRFRPDLFVNGRTEALPVYSAANAGTMFPIDETMYPAFVQYVVATAEMRDDTWTEDGKGKVLLEGFLNNLANSPYRHSDGFLYGCVNAALHEARRVRPDLFLGGSIGLRAILPMYSGTDADEAAVLPIDERYYTPVVDYVVARARARQGEPPDPKGATYAQVFAVQLMAPA